MRDKARRLRREGRHEDAKKTLVELAALHPNDSELQYETACVLDFLGEEAAAVRYYEAALSGILSPDSRRGAFAGLGSTFRILGRYTEAETALRRAIEEFPGANEMRVFLAATLHNLGRSSEAVEMLMGLLAATSSDEGIKAYSRAIAMYSQDIDRVGGEP